MKKYQLVVLFLSLFILPLSAIAQSGVNRGYNAPPAEAKVQVDCNAGDSITDALNVRAEVLTIEINGMCEEDVNILRSNVIFNGASIDATLDGIVAPAGDDRAVTIFGVNTIEFENLSLIGGRFGLSMNATFGVDVRNSIIEVSPSASSNSTFGVIIGSASGSITLDNTEISSTSFGARGLWATNGSNVRCSECTIDSFSRGILATQGSEIVLWGTTVQNTGRAVELLGGSRLTAIQRCHDFPICSAPVPSDLTGVRSLVLTGTASASVANSNLNGRLQLSDKSVLSIQNVAHTIGGGTNTLEGDSSLVVDGAGSVVGGSLNISEFSNLSLSGGSTIGGALSCSSGGDAYCDDGNDVLGGSDCSQCISPPP